MDKVPRRVQRFYRNNSAPQPENDYQTEEQKQEEYDSPTGRPILQTIPGMDYQDIEIDKKNMEEIKKIEQKNMEEKLALDQIERFKKENKRLPTKQESDQIAETLYTQLKNSDDEEVSEEMKNPLRHEYIEGENEASGQGESRRSRRMARIKGKELLENTQKLSVQEQRAKQREIEKQERLLAQQKKHPQQTAQVSQEYAPIQPSSEIADVKSLLEEDLGLEEKGKNKKKGEDEFDLGMDDEVNEEATVNNDSDNIDDLALDEEECPNCKKDTSKIIYCPKCGTAYCSNCGKKDVTNQYICPKCGAKTKA
jgi:hypothetical protein